MTLSYVQALNPGIIINTILPRFDMSGSGFTTPVPEAKRAKHTGIIKHQHQPTDNQNWASSCHITAHARKNGISDYARARHQILKRATRSQQNVHVIDARNFPMLAKSGMKQTPKKIGSPISTRRSCSQIASTRIERITDAQFLIGQHSNVKTVDGQYLLILRY